MSNCSAEEMASKWKRGDRHEVIRWLTATVPAAEVLHLGRLLTDDEVSDLLFALAVHDVAPSDDEWDYTSTGPLDRVVKKDPTSPFWSGAAKASKRADDLPEWKKGELREPTESKGGEG